MMVSVELYPNDGQRAIKMGKPVMRMQRKHCHQIEAVQNLSCLQHECYFLSKPLQLPKLKRHLNYAPSSLLSRLGILVKVSKLRL